MLAGRFSLYTYRTCPGVQAQRCRVLAVVSLPGFGALR